MQVIRTPDDRFQDLPGYSFEPNYQEVDDGDGGTLRIHYVDAGPQDGEVLLCMHGQPTWSYLYRKMIPVFVDAGYRVIAPDLVGFGRSDKPTQRTDYTYANHVGWIDRFINALDLQQVTLVCQDWGGLIGLRVLTQNVQRFARLVVANTGLPDGQGIDPAMAAPMHDMLAQTPALPPLEMAAKLAENENGVGFFYWIKYCAEFAEFNISDVMSFSSGGQIDADIARAYDAPFPDEAYKQGARQFPSLVPIIPDNPAIPDNQAAWKILEAFDKPVLTAFSDGDPVTAGGEKRFQESVAGAQGQQHVTISGAGHFLQEDKGEEFASAVLQFCQDNPLS